MKNFFYSAILFIVSVLCLPAIEQVSSESSGSASLAASAAPMPERLPHLTSPAALKAYALRQVTIGTVYLNGGMVSHEEGMSYTVSASTPGQIVAALSQHQFNFSLPAEIIGQKIMMSGMLSDRSGMTRFYSQSEAVPTKRPDGTYVLMLSQVLKTLDYQWVELSGDIVSAVITHENESGSWAEVLTPYSPGYYWVNGELHSGNSGVFIRMSSLTADGHFMVVRNEPDGNGGVKKVAYSYSLATGEKTSTVNASHRSSITIENYAEANDGLLPPYNTIGGPVQISIDLSVKQAMESAGEKGVIVEVQSQPVGRLDLSYSRTVRILFGLFNTSVSPIQLIEMPRAVQIYKNGTLFKEVPVGSSGQIDILLPAGSFDILTPLENFKVFPGVG